MSSSLNLILFLSTVEHGRPWCLQPWAKAKNIKSFAPFPGGDGEKAKKQTQLPTPLDEPPVEQHPDQCPEGASHDERPYNSAAVSSPQPGPDLAALVREAMKKHLQAAGLLPATPTIHHHSAPHPQPSPPLQPTIQPGTAPQP